MLATTIHIESGVPALVRAPASWQRWIARSALPVPTKIVVRNGHKGGDAVMESFPGGSIVIHRPAGVDDATAMHEVGHQFNFEYMTYADEQEFEAQVLGGDGHDWFYDGDYGAFGTPYGEEFAELYSDLARHPHLTKANQFDNEGYLVRDMTSRQIARARVLIRTFARAKGWQETTTP